MPANPPLHSTLPLEQQAKLQLYVTLLLQWNKRVNLIARQDEPQIWTRHIDDCLQLLPYLPPPGQGRILDIGTGAGLPGLVLAIAGYFVTAVDSDQKKIVFVKEAARHCGLTDFEAVRGRTETLPVQAFSAIVSRATAPIAQLLGWTEPLLADCDRMLLLKGKQADTELLTAQEKWQMTTRTFPSMVNASDGFVVELTKMRRK